MEENRRMEIQFEGMKGFFVHRERQLDSGPPNVCFERCSEYVHIKRGGRSTGGYAKNFETTQSNMLIDNYFLFKMLFLFKCFFVWQTITMKSSFGKIFGNVFQLYIIKQI